MRDCILTPLLLQRIGPGYSSVIPCAVYTAQQNTINAISDLCFFHQRQARRVYEILRLMSTNTADEKEMRAYRIDVKRRLEAPLKVI